MILGYLDAEDRVYDLNFATLKMKLRMEDRKPAGLHVAFLSTGASGEAAYPVRKETDATASAAMDHAGHLVPLLRPVPGHLYRHARGLLFLADPPKRDPEDPSFYLVKLRALPSAVKFFFEDQEGTELISIPSDEVVRVGREGDAMRVSVSAAGLALPKETLTYAVDFTPAERVAPLLEDLSPPS